MQYGYAITDITIKEKEYRVCMRLDENRKMTGISINNPQELSILNHIYVGRVERDVPSIKAFFVCFSSGQNCFLPYEECKNPFYVKKNSKKNELSCGDEILVQITREAIKQKEPAASCNLSLQGKYMVLTTDRSTLSISRKLSNESRNRIKDIFSDYSNDFTNYGLIIRTLAEEQTKEAILEDYQSVKEAFLKLQETYTHKELYSVVYEEPPQYINYLKNQIVGHNDFITTDKTEVIDEIKQYLPHISNEIQFYEDKSVSLSTLYNMKGNLDSLLSKKVWMKSGSNIIIEQLETLTFIDVNSAKIDGKNSDALSINKEAAILALEQISLRNISGMILIDFINMNEEKNEELIRFLKNSLKQYPNPCQFIDITKLGLVELTRKKVHKSMKEICEYS